MKQKAERQRVVGQVASDEAVGEGAQGALVGADLPLADPVQPLSAAPLGKALGNVSEENVRQRERAGELFSIVRPARKRGREYPAFQARPWDHW